MLGVWALCSSDVSLVRVGDWAPYFMERSELERSVGLAGEPRPMSSPGKIWMADTRIFVVERYKGVHVIDNSNPENPRRVDFLRAPGCMDVAVKGEIIYLDNAVDLVAFDLTANVVTKRERNYFSPPVSPDGGRYYSGGDMILVGWRKVEEEGRL